jgi:RNA polymerase sigma-70 factor (ECF subfamily)
MLTATNVLENSSLSPIRTKASTVRIQEFHKILCCDLPSFHRMAMRWLRNREDAEDAVQEAMLSAFKNLARFDGRSQMKTWVTAIVINAVRMQMRRRRVQMISLEHCGQDGQQSISEILADPRPRPDDTSMEAELRVLLNRLWSCLPASQQSALKLRQDGLAIKEIAELLGVAVGTVKARLTRGRKRLTTRFCQVTQRTKRGKARSDSDIRHAMQSASDLSNWNGTISEVPAGVLNAKLTNKVWVGA